MKISAPANVHLLRAQVILILGALIPTILTTPLGIILLASGDPGWVEIVTGVLVLAFAASSVTGFLIGGIFLRRGSAMVKVQHDFLSSVSHELRTPLTSMRMFIDALLDERLTDSGERERCLSVLHQEVDRLDGLIGKLLELSRLEADRVPYQQVKVAIADVVSEAVRSFEALQVIDATQLHVEVADELHTVGDHTALVLVFTNLLSNAWKYSGDHKEVRVDAKAASDREVEIVVSDSGPGIPSDEQKRVFDKFWRGRDAHESGTRGSGLGLAIVKAIIKAHRGRVELRSPPGSGASFHVFLPRAKV